MRKYSPGFSSLEIILAVAVIGLIGTVAWMFVSNQESDNAASESHSVIDNNNKTNQSDKTSDNSENWLTWQPSGKQYSIKFADGWNVYLKAQGDASFYTHGSLESKPGIQAKVSDTRHDVNAPSSIQPCTDNTHGGVILDYMNYAYPAKWYNGNETTIKTNGGLDIKKTISPPSDGSQGIPTNYTTYSYVLSSTNESVIISYTACDKGPDRRELVEEVVKTFEF